MFERTPGNIEVVFPMKEGVISRFTDMQYLLQNLLKKKRAHFYKRIRISDRIASRRGDQKGLKDGLMSLPRLNCEHNQKTCAGYHWRYLDEDGEGIRKGALTDRSYRHTVHRLATVPVPVIDSKKGLTERTPAWAASEKTHGREAKFAHSKVCFYDTVWHRSDCEYKKRVPRRDRIRKEM